MCRLFETIKIEDNQLRNIRLHSERMNEARCALFAASDTIDLTRMLSVPEQCREGLHKCKVIYSTEIHSVTFERYNRRTISSLKIVRSDDIDYHYKLEDRGRIDDLLKQKEDHDDILIVKDNMITDTSFSNIAFHDGVKWTTPSTPLLKGTKRKRLLAMGLIVEDEIRVSDLALFKKASLINAMLELGETVIELENIM